MCVGRKIKYLCTQVEVAEQNCCLRAGDDQNNENQKEEAEHVVHLVRPAIQRAKREKRTQKRDLQMVQERQFSLPDTVENKEELDEDTAKRQNSTHNDSRNGLCEE